MKEGHCGLGMAMVKSNIFVKSCHTPHTHTHIHIPSTALPHKKRFYPLILIVYKLLKFTSSRANQLMVHCWFGARCFGILGVPWKSLSNNLFHKGIPNFQTTRPQITHLPLVEQTWRKNNHHPNLHGLAPIHPVTGDFSNAQVTWPRRKYS